MDKQDAIDFIVEQFEQGDSPSEIARSLGKELNAPYEVTLRFVTRSLEQRMALIGSNPPAAPAPGPSKAVPEPSRAPAVRLDSSSSALESLSVPLSEESSSESSPTAADFSQLEPEMASWEVQTGPADMNGYKAEVFLTGGAPGERPDSATGMSMSDDGLSPGEDEGGRPGSVPSSVKIDPKLEKFILDALGRDKKHSDIVLAVCERTGLDWSRAQRMVGRIEGKNRKKIASRRNRILIPFAIVAIIAGIGLIAAALIELSHYMNIFGTLNSANINGMVIDPQSTFYDLRYLIFYAVSGFTLLAGGTYGLIQAIRAQME